MHHEKIRLIEQYETGGTKLRQAIAAVPPQLIHLPSEPGRWSILELAVHLADMDAVGLDRMKRVVSDDLPTLPNADENAFLEKLHPQAQSLDDAVTLLETGRRQWTRVLRRLTDEDFERAGLHSADGRLTLTQLLERYVRHLDHHLPFIAGKLQRLRHRR